MNQPSSVSEAVKTIFERLYFEGAIQGIIQEQASEPRRGTEPLWVRDALTIYRSLGNVFEFVPDEEVLRQVAEEELPSYVVMIATSNDGTVEQLQHQIRFRVREDFLEKMILLRDEFYPSKIRDE
jgi:predicted glycosyltransferase